MRWYMCYFSVDKSVFQTVLIFLECNLDSSNYIRDYIILGINSPMGHLGE